MKMNCARKILQDFSPKPAGKCKANNCIFVTVDLQIIVPAYNAEQYIEECLNSIVNQRTKYSFIVTVVDDGSTDHTAEILSRFNLPRVEIITQENKGLSGARNTGLSTIKGKYVTFVDSDDSMPQGAIENILNMAYSTQADIVQGAYTTFGEGLDFKYEIKTEGVLDNPTGIFTGFAWGKAYRYNVLQSFRFPEGYWFEDTPISYILEAMPYRFAATKELVYCYRINPEGITRNAAYNRRSVESYWITEECLMEFPEFGVQYDQRSYEYTLRQIVTNFQRSRKMPWRVQKSIFYLETHLLKQYFTEDIYTIDKTMQGIEKTLKSNSYVLFYVLLKIIHR